MKMLWLEEWKVGTIRTKEVGQIWFKLQERQARWEFEFARAHDSRFEYIVKNLCG